MEDIAQIYLIYSFIEVVAKCPMSSFRGNFCVITKLLNVLQTVNAYYWPHIWYNLGTVHNPFRQQEISVGNVSCEYCPNTD